MTHRMISNLTLLRHKTLHVVTSPLPLLPFIAKTTASISTSTDASDILLRTNVTSSGITTLTLNNPAKHNVLSWDMLDALQNQLDDIGSDSVRRHCKFSLSLPTQSLFHAFPHQNPMIHF